MLCFALNRAGTVFKHEDDGTINPLVYHGVKAMSYGSVPFVHFSAECVGASHAGGSCSCVVAWCFVATGMWLPRTRKRESAAVHLCAGRLRRTSLNSWPHSPIGASWTTCWLTCRLAQATSTSLCASSCKLPQRWWLLLHTNSGSAGAGACSNPHWSYPGHCCASSYIDVIKGIDMFDNLKVPTLALVENMAYFECEHGTKYYPFGTRACWHASAASPLLIVHPASEQAPVVNPHS